jgi:hypothetical protein
MPCYDRESVRLALLPDVDYAEDSECNDNDAKYEIFVTINAWFSDSFFFCIVGFSVP